MKNITFYLSTLLSLTLLTACGGSDSSNDESETPTSQTTDSPIQIITPTPTPAVTATPAITFTPTPTPTATADTSIKVTTNLSTGSIQAPKFAYYDIDTASELMLTEEEAAANNEWDIAFRRTKVFLNNHTDPAVSLYFLENVDEFYNTEGRAVVDRFVNATAETELPLFENLNAVIPEDDSSFVTDTQEPTIKGYYIYNPADHTVAANPNAVFIVDSDEAMTQFSVTNLEQNGFGMNSITLSAGYQATGESTFAAAQTLTIEATACGDSVYVDFDTLTTVGENNDWDIAIPCENNLLDFAINIADDAQAIGNQSFSKVDGIDSANAPFFPWLGNVSDSLAYVEAGDERSTYGWGEYGVNGGNILWPNYATYIIKTNAGYYKFQITNYYHTESFASGAYSVRHQLIQAAGN